MSEKFKVGQKVFVIPINDNARHYRNTGTRVPVTEYTITKVGRKYYYLNGSLSDLGFCKDRNESKSEHTSQYKAYVSLQAIEDERECRKKGREISDKFRYSSSLEKLGIEKIRAIYDIIFKEQS